MLLCLIFGVNSLNFFHKLIYQTKQFRGERYFWLIISDYTLSLQRSKAGAPDRGFKYVRADRHVYFNAYFIFLIFYSSSFLCLGNGTTHSRLDRPKSMILI